MFYVCVGAAIPDENFFLRIAINAFYFIYFWLSFRRMPSPCEMNEFSVECEEWEEINGPYSIGKYMMKSNARTKGY
jgi:hypothetical protein